jgi:hypothetical protein
MKAIKFKIVVLLLLIIFFGLLILFWLNNTYEGLTNRPSPLKTKSVGEPTKWVVGTGVNDNAAKPKGTYYIRVYYYIPDNYQFDDKGNKNFNNAGIPIIYLDHNLDPTLYNVYYSNKDAFSDELNQSNNVNIYIQSNSESNNSVSKLTPTKVWKEIAISAGNQQTVQNLNTQLKVWANGKKDGKPVQKWEKNTVKINPRQLNAPLNKKITDISLIYSPSNGTGILTSTSPNGSAPSAAPKDELLSTLLPINYTKLTKDNTIVYLDASYSSPNITNAIVVNKDLDNNADLGALNLVTYYLTFPT